MSAITEASARHDAQRALNRPLVTLADAGRAITTERKALLRLLEVAELDVVLGNASPAVEAAVDAVRVVRR